MAAASVRALRKELRVNNSPAARSVLLVQRLRRVAEVCPFVGWLAELLSCLLPWQQNCLQKSSSAVRAAAKVGAFPCSWVTEAVLVQLCRP